VMPGRTARFMASSIRRTMAPAARMPARSSGPVMDMLLAYRIGRTARGEIEHQDEAGDEKRDHLPKFDSNEPQDNSVERHCFTERERHDITSAPASQRSRVLRIPCK